MPLPDEFQGELVLPRVQGRGRLTGDAGATNGAVAKRVDVGNVEAVDDVEEVIQPVEGEPLGQLEPPRQPEVHHPHRRAPEGVPPQAAGERRPLIQGGTREASARQEG